MARLLREHVFAQQLGAAGHRHVHERFLMPRLLRDRLLLHELARGSRAPEAAA